MKKLTDLILMPFEDFLSGLEACLEKITAPGILAIALSFLISWWIYVPVHELLHALGCIAGGGAVSRLEISPLYGASFLKHIFPFISAGSEYAGQLTGFDTKGSDFTYLLTDFFPFLLTIFIGVPLLKSAARSRPPSACVKFGLALPMAFAPFISFSGDYYEMGSIIISRIWKFLSPGFQTSVWRSDDLFKLVTETSDGGRLSTGNITGILISFITGLIVIYATYTLGVLWSRLILKRKQGAKE